jgi:hypothetical protein
MDKELLENEDSKKALFAILCMQQRFESLYNYIVLNRDNKEEINAEFFNKLAGSDTPGTVLKDKNIDTEDGEPEQIREFLVYFNKTLIAADEEVDEDSVDRLRTLLKSSSVTATPPNEPATAKLRPTFIYNGDTYMTQGANRMNLSNLALRLIKDYAKDTDKTAEELIGIIDARIPYYTTVLKKAGLGQITERTNPQLKKRELLELHFSAKDEIVRLDGKELLVSKGWGTGELMTLIDILGYGDKVDSNMK